MTDPETLIIKAGMIVLVSLAMLRLVVHDIRSLKDDLFGKRKKQ